MKKNPVKLILAVVLILAMLCPVSALAADTAGEFVEDLYRNILGREADAAGKADWVSQLESGAKTGAQVAWGFVFSREYTNKGTSDSDYTEMLYRALLGRESDAGGKAGWISCLNKGATREYLFAGFVNSREFGNMCQRAGIRQGSYTSSSIFDRNLNVTDFVRRMYTECLGRSPEKGGWQNWIRKLLDGSSGAQIVQGFFESAEFVGKGYDNEAYLHRLYHALFDRDPDAGGLNSWLKSMAGGTSRKRILAAFVAAPEFANLCSRYGIVQGKIQTMLEPGIHAGTDIFYDQGGPVIVIDAGHQAHGMSAKEPNGPGSSVMKAKVTSGTQGVATGVEEHVLNLKVSLKLRDILLARGYSVVMVRETADVEISNVERTQIANRHHAAVFIRVHANSESNSSLNGVLTICQTRNNPYKASLYNTNRRLSQLVLDRVCAATGAKNMGIWETDDMTGINWSDVPVTILEMGYMSNAAEDRRLQESSYQDKIAQGAANGIDAFLGR